MKKKRDCKKILERETAERFIEEILRFDKLSDRLSSRKLMTRLFQKEQDNRREELVSIYKAL